MPFSSKVYSPFMFLNSYQKDDVESYFGRKKETIRLFDLYKDSSLIILHGPSGSGKTSLIYCGLLNKTHLTKNSVLSIRRNNNLIDSVKKELFISTDISDKIIDNQSNLLDNFLDSHSELKRISRGIETIDEMTLQVEDKIIKLERKQQKISIDQEILLEEIVEDIKKYKHILDEYVAERDKSIEKLTTKNQEVIEASHNINAFFRQKNKRAHHVPLIIFDQFEELFVYARKEEIHKFGLFLKLVFDYKIPFNIIISLREEFFGHLDQLQSYIPHIFYKKIRLAHPNRDTITKIIERSFAKFNINQYKDHVTIEERKKLSQQEKDNRISDIINQIKIQEGSEISYHLPFLQVYLDSLYKLDHQRTYPAAIPPEIVSHYGSYPPLEFKQQEIKEFGSIENVLEKYIRAVNYKIINNTNNKLNNRNQHKDSVIKFLRHFKTKDDLKKRIPIHKQKKGGYIIDNQKLLNKIQTDLWGNINDDEYNGTISEIIEELNNKGILNISSDYIELSHDIIAKVISNIRIEEDFKSLIKKDFNSSFAIYKESEGKEGLLTRQQIMRIRQFKDFIVYDDDHGELERKQRFFDDSYIEVQKEKLAKEKQNLKLRKYFNFSRIISIILFLSLIALGIYFEKTRTSARIYEETGNAFEFYNVDKTFSFNQIRESENSISDEGFSTSILSLFGVSKFDLLGDFKNKFYKDYLKNPFYFKSINLEQGHIINTKTRSTENEDTILLFALTANKNLVVREIHYTKQDTQNINKFNPLKNITAYEPFDTKYGTFILVAQEVDKQIVLRLIDAKGIYHDFQIEGLSPILLEKSSVGDIETIKKEKYKEKEQHHFLVGIDTVIYQIDLNIPDTLPYSGAVISKKSVIHKVRRIKTFKDSLEGKNKENYLALYGKNNFLYYNKKKDVFTPIMINISDSIYSFKKIDNSKVLIGLDGSLRSFNLNDSNDGIVTSKDMGYKHDKRISTIDESDEQILLGSFDNMASLWSKDNKLLKQFVGHTDAIHNVSFIEKKGDPKKYIISSGEDQQIKIWDISPIQIPATKKDTLIMKNKVEYIDSIFENLERKNIILSKFNKIEKNVSLDSIKLIRYHKKNKTFAIIFNNCYDIYMYRDTLKPYTLKWHKDKIQDISFSKDGNYLVSGSWDNKAIIWKKKNNYFSTLDTLTAHTSDVQDVEFFGNDILLTASKDNTVQIYERKEKENWLARMFSQETGDFEQIPSLIRHDYALKAATFSQEDKLYIISKDKEGIVKKWDFKEFEPLVKERTYNYKASDTIK